MKNIYFAPLEGIGNHIYRNVYRRYYGGISKYYTPFLDLSSEGLMKNRGLRDILPENNEGIHVIPQVLTASPDALKKAAQVLSGYGYDEVNINMGCPVGTVTKKGKGAAMLSDRDRLRSFLDGAFSGCATGLSVKMRIGMTDISEGAGLIKIMNDYPLREVIIHPRLQTEFYQGEIHEEILEAMCRESVNPVCINPGIRTPEQYDSFCEKYPDCTALMIGRGLITDPALPEKCTGTVIDPNKEAARFLSFHNALLAAWKEELSGEPPVLFKMKELWDYWKESLHPDEKILKKIKKARTLSEYEALSAMLLS